MTDSMTDKDLHALFLRELKDIYFAENAIIEALPKMADAARGEPLKGALLVHLEETRNQVKRLDQVFKQLGEKPQGTECKAIEAIIGEGEEITKEFKSGKALDAGLISAAQAVEHYEITRYGTLLAWAKQLGMTEAEGLLKETLVEEENADDVLSELAEDAVNPKAA
jgi:ferritin-like metal-binding protein YciE